ncbi:MAG: sigma-70 family RNA polymerase sigma factor [Acidobacteriota bacterium]
MANGPNDRSAPPDDVTRLLIAWSEGDEAALDQVLARVYDELHRLARWQMRGERAGHTLQPTALIHEAYLQLVDQRASWKSRKHFFAIAARCMRRIVLQHARRRAADKRGGGLSALPLDEAIMGERAQPADLLDLGKSLERLEAIEPRQAEIVDLRFFSGYTCAEIAKFLEVSEATVNRDWKVARAWLTCELRDGGYG